MNPDAKITATQLIRHYKSMLTYSNVNIDDNHIALWQTAKKMAADEVTRTIAYLNQLFTKLAGADKSNDSVFTMHLIEAEKNNWKTILQILESENE